MPAGGGGLASVPVPKEGLSKEESIGMVFLVFEKGHI